MLKTMYWADAWRLPPLVRDYPVYHPPHRQASHKLRNEHAKDNFDYFVKVKDSRVDALISFTKRIDIPVTPGQDIIQTASNMAEWMYRYSPVLSKEIGRIDQPVFSDPGCSMIFDIGIFWGQELIRSQLCDDWIFYFDEEADEEAQHSLVFQEPVLDTLPQYICPMRQAAGRAFDFWRNARRNGFPQLPLKQLLERDLISLVNWLREKRRDVPGI